jgi:hypothetical protein
MKPEKSYFSTIIITVVVTAIITVMIVNCAMYLQSIDSDLLPPMKEGRDNISEEDYTLLTQDEENGSNLVSVRGIVNSDDIPYSSGFSLEFPPEWGLINVQKNNLRNSGPKITQYAEYIFTSEFGAPQGFVTITVSSPKYKTDALVTQNNRKFINEDADFYYNYNGSTEYCIEPANIKLSNCTEAEVTKTNKQIDTIIKSFKILN